MKIKNPKEKKFYVYEWYNADSGEVFYVGKGTGNRRKQVSGRNKFFLSYFNKYDCDVRTISDNMTNEDALLLEADLILTYRSTGQCRTNLTDGGEDAPVLSGDKNGMFGRSHTKESREKMSASQKASGMSKGKNNNQYGVSPKDRMDEKTYNEWRKKQRARKDGSTNPNYGNKKLSEFYSNNPDVSKEKNSRSGASNGRATPIAMYNDKGFYMEFDYMTLCAKYMMEQEISRTKNPYNSVANISSAAKNGKTYFGFNFRFI